MIGAPKYKAKYKYYPELRRAFQHIVDLDDNNNVVEEHWINKEGFYHRGDGPARTVIAKDRSLREEWFQNGLRHRIDGPATLLWADKSKTVLQLEEWHENGLLNREDGPAETSFYKNGNTKRTTWRHMGQLHRLDGPAHCFFLRDGREASRQYWEWNKRKSVETLVELRKPVP